MKKKIIVAISGGVDSSVAAFLLREQGYEVAGITMITGNGQNKEINTAEDAANAAEVCRILDIPHYTVDYQSEMEEDVIQPFIDEYKIGRTPNPCIVCNKKIKFGRLLEKAVYMGYDMIATGHYARNISINGRYVLKRAKDEVKDQTYFLYSLESDVLEKVMFPLGDYSKEEVRKIAAEQGLPVTESRESQDICFFPGGNVSAFFDSRGIESAQGDIVDLEGRVIGVHKGIMHYTVGQRKGLGISAPDPLYVVSIDYRNNRLVAAEKRFLRSRGLEASVVNMNTDILEGEALGKIRYAHKAAECDFNVKGDRLEVVFRNPQEAITPGQAVVLYRNDCVLGGGIIERVSVA